MTNIPDPQRELDTLRQQLQKLTELIDGLGMTDLLPKRDELEARKAAIEASIQSSPRAQQAIGSNNIQVYIEQRYEDPAAQRRAQARFRDYLSGVWRQLVRLPCQQRGEMSANHRSQMSAERRSRSPLGIPTPSSGP